MNDTGKAIAALELSIKLQYPTKNLILGDKDFDSIKPDERFTRIMESLGHCTGKCSTCSYRKYFHPTVLIDHLFGGSGDAS